MKQLKLEELPLTVSDLVSFITTKIKERERHDLNIFLGKLEKPAPVIKNGKTKEYIHIDIDDVCRRIRLADKIFTSLYKFRLHKNDTLSTIPAEILTIFNVYDNLCSELSKSNVNSEVVAGYRKWIADVGMVGIIRHLGLANSPYMLLRDIKRHLKRFFTNLDNIYHHLKSTTKMMGVKNKGLLLFGYEYNKSRIVKGNIDV